MQKYQCLICGDDMEMHHKIAYYDCTCSKSEDHQFTMRIISNIMMGTKSLAKLRVAFHKERLFLKVHYDKQYSEVWGKNNSAKRIKIEQIVVPDFMDIAKLKNKIRTLLVFA
jgi:hypothetical protein